MRLAKGQAHRKPSTAAGATHEASRRISSVIRPLLTTTQRLMNEAAVEEALELAQPDTELLLMSFVHDPTLLRALLQRHAGTAGRAFPAFHFIL